MALLTFHSSVETCDVQDVNEYENLLSVYLRIILFPGHKKRKRKLAWGCKN